MARERLGELLLRAGVLTQAQLVTALREQAKTGVRLGQLLLDYGWVEEATLYDAIAKMTGLERFNLRTAILEKSALNLVTADWALEHGIAPYRIDVPGRTIYVAITDPTNLVPVDDVAFRSGLKAKVVIASETELQRVLRHHFWGEPLDRDPRNVHRPGGPQRSGDIDPGLIIRGMDNERDEVLSQRPEPRREESPTPVLPDPLAETSRFPALEPPARDEGDRFTPLRTASLPPGSDSRFPALRTSSLAPLRPGSPPTDGARPRLEPKDVRFAELRPVPTRPAAHAAERMPTSEIPTRDLVREPPSMMPGPQVMSLGDDDRAALARLKPIFDVQEEAARALRAIFELCVAKGIIRRDEYLERLRRTPD